MTLLEGVQMGAPEPGPNRSMNIYLCVLCDLCG